MKAYEIYAAAVAEYLYLLGPCRQGNIALLIEVESFQALFQDEVVGGGLLINNHHNLWFAQILDGEGAQLHFGDPGYV